MTLVAARMLSAQRWARTAALRLPDIPMALTPRRTSLDICLFYAPSVGSGARGRAAWGRRPQPTATRQAVLNLSTLIDAGLPVHGFECRHSRLCASTPLVDSRTNFYEYLDARLEGWQPATSNSTHRSGVLGRGDAGAIGAQALVPSAFATLGCEPKQRPPCGERRDRWYYLHGFTRTSLGQRCLSRAVVVGPTMQKCEIDHHGFGPAAVHPRRQVPDRVDHKTPSPGFK